MQNTHSVKGRAGTVEERERGEYKGWANEKTRACNNHSQVLHIYRRNQVNCARRAAKTEGRQEEQEKTHNRKHKTQNRHEKTDNSQLGVGGQLLLMDCVSGRGSGGGEGYVCGL